jgi:hypothetical protein
LAVIFFLFLLTRKFGIDLSLLYKSIVVSISLVVLAIFLSANFATGLDPIFEIGGSILLTLVAMGLFMLSALDLVRWLKHSGHTQTEAQV